MSRPYPLLGTTLLAAALQAYAQPSSPGSAIGQAALKTLIQSHTTQGKSC